MMEKKTVICISDGRRIKIPGVTKVILAIKTPDIKPLQASIKLSPENLRKIRQNIKE